MENTFLEDYRSVLDILCEDDDVRMLTGCFLIGIGGFFSLAGIALIKFTPLRMYFIKED